MVASLVRARHIHSIVCTVGAIEQDIMKTMHDFKMGEYRMDDGLLNEMGINRTGNVLVSNDSYVIFEKFMEKQ